MENIQNAKKFYKEIGFFFKNCTPRENRSLINKKRNNTIIKDKIKWRKPKRTHIASVDWNQFMFFVFFKRLI